MSIRCLTTLIGENIIGEISENLDGSVLVKKPMLVLMNPNGQGGFQIGLFPYLPFAKQKEFTFNRNQFLFLFDSVDDLRNEYIRATTGLVIPQTEEPKLGLIQ